MERETAKAALVLWNSAQFDTEAIARLLGEKEHAVARIIQASREFAQEHGGVDG